MIFLLLYGEEHGLVGSRYTTEHPVWPLKSTIANVNLEQIGRTDDEEGERKNAMCMTGFTFSTLGPALAASGKRVGVEVSNHPKFSAPFFSASDNASFAAKGIPSGTLCTAFMFPDYHKVGDHSDRLDYQNMEKVTRAIAQGVIDLANAPSAPAWNPDVPQVRRYLEAAAKLRSGI